MTYSYYFEVDFSHSNEMIILGIIFAIWIFSIVRFIRYTSCLLKLLKIEAKICSNLYLHIFIHQLIDLREFLQGMVRVANTPSKLWAFLLNRGWQICHGGYLLHYDSVTDSLKARNNGKLNQPWKFPSLVSLPLHHQRDHPDLLSVPSSRFLASSSSSLPLSLRQQLASPNVSSQRSDSDPTVYWKLKRPSIVLTKASLEDDGKWYKSINSRLPSRLTLFSNDLNSTPPSPFPSTPNKESFATESNESFFLFPEHRLSAPSSPSNQTAELSLRRRTSMEHGRQKSPTRTPSLETLKERKVMQGVLRAWSKQTTL